MKRKTIHDRRLNEDDPSFPHPDSNEYKLMNTARPFSTHNFGTDTRRGSKSPSLSGKGFGQVLIDWDEETNFDE